MIGGSSHAESNRLIDITHVLYTPIIFFPLYLLRKKSRIYSSKHYCYNKFTLSFFFGLFI